MRVTYIQAGFPDFSHGIDVGDRAEGEAGLAAGTQRCWGTGVEGDRDGRGGLTGFSGGRGGGPA